VAANRSVSSGGGLDQSNQSLDYSPNGESSPGAAGQKSLVTGGRRAGICGARGLGRPRQPIAMHTPRRYRDRMATETTRQSRHLLVNWMEQEGSVLVEAQLIGILGAVPELSKGRDPEGELRVALTSHLVGIRRAFGDPSSVATLPNEAETWSRQLVHDGGSLTAALRAFERGHADAWRIIASTLKESRWGLSPEVRADAMEYASVRLFDYANTITAQAISAYLDEQARLERRDESSRLRVVTGLLQGDLDPRMAERSIAYRLDASQTGYTLWDTSGADRVHLETVASELCARIGPWQHLTVRSDSGSLNGWLSCNANRLQLSLHGWEPPPGIQAAFGSTHWGLSGFRLSHREALEAKRVSRAIGGQPLTTYDDVGVLALASRDTELACAFVEVHLGSLGADDEKSRNLRETLRVLLQERGSPAATAARLRLHRNTVVKRIERIEESLDAPIDRGSLNLRVALELARILPAGHRSQIRRSPPGNGPREPSIL
jgi:DNA-binding PucR family transcriptional regulator